MKLFIFCLLGLIATQVNAFQDDWVMTERFNNQLALAKQGDAAAQYDVGRMYLHGRGVAANAQQAEQWLNRAATQGNVSAKTSLGVMYFEGKKITPNYVRAFSLLQSAATRNVAQAQFYLGRMYEEGRGIQADVKLALRWYGRAVASGYFGADAKVTELTEKLNHTQHAARAVSATKPVAVAQTKPPPPSALQQVLNGNWHRSEQPSGFLPSTITQCRMADDMTTLNCRSTSQTRRTMAAEVTYSTHAQLIAAAAPGEFELSYINEVSGVQPLQHTDPELENEAFKVSVKLGDKSREHKLSCRLESAQKLTCVRDNVRSLSFISP